MRSIAPAVRVAACVALALTLAGCGEEPDPDGAAGPSASGQHSAGETTTPAPTPTAAPLPKCADVWVAGKAFPELYEGCRADGEEVPGAPLICESTQQIYAYGDHFYAVGGGEVVRTKGPYQDDPHYLKVHRSCTG